MFLIFLFLFQIKISELHLINLKNFIDNLIYSENLEHVIFIKYPNVNISDSLFEIFEIPKFVFDKESLSYNSFNEYNFNKNFLIILLITLENSLYLFEIYL